MENLAFRFEPDNFDKTFNESDLTALYFKKVSLSKAVGKDGVRKGTFENRIKEEVSLILRKVTEKSYKFTTYKEKLISKGYGKNPRQLSIPTLRDRLTLRATCDVVTKEFEDAVTQAPHEYIKQICALLKTLDANDYSFLRMDIQEYYPSIQHDILLNKLKSRITRSEILHLLESAIKTPTSNSKPADTANPKGVPQGLSISNILSSIYLLELDQQFKKKIHYFRYVDDILVICKNDKIKKIHAEISAGLEVLGLKSHPLENASKTQISSLTAGIEYLGFHITPKLVAVRQSSYNRMFYNLLKVFTSYRYSQNKKRFLFRLNLKITGCIYEEKRCGWMFFFAQSGNKSQLKYLDKFVADMLVKYKVDSLKNEVKTFTKAYHEIRFNAAKTNYIENIGTYTLEQKIELILTLTGKSPEEAAAWNVQYIDYLFDKHIRKEVSQLEKDILDVFY